MPDPVPDEASAAAVYRLIASGIAAAAAVILLALNPSYWYERALPAFAAAIALESWPRLRDLWRKRSRRRSLSAATRRHRVLAENTYFKYRDARTPLLTSEALVEYLEGRYRCRSVNLGSKRYPVTVLWQNINSIVRPDSILGKLDMSPPRPFASAPHLRDDEYSAARDFIKADFEDGPIKYEGCDYRLKHIKTTRAIAQIDGAFGLYYDNILTQYAIEWELKKALVHREMADAGLSWLSEPGTLPLREAIEAASDPLRTGEGRCAAISVSTLVVFRRPGQTGYWCVLSERSQEVGVSPGLLHVAPAGMFEADNTVDRWSVELNIWRELLEELYDREEQRGRGRAEIRDSILRQQPVELLMRMLEVGSAQLVVTGVVCDLLNLRTEICTLLFVDDPAFVVEREMRLNWEYQPPPRSSSFVIQWQRLEGFINSYLTRGEIAASGAACLSLGREWLKEAGLC